MLTLRQQIVLTSIVEAFVESGTPVSSKTLLNYKPIEVSSATIRAEMKKLEDFGLIEKTHVSSGRIPSIKGYKYYVSTLKEEMNPGNVILSHDYKDVVDKIAQETQYLSVMTGDRHRLISHLHLTAIRSQLLLLAVYQNGMISHHLLDSKAPINAESFNAINLFLNKHIDALNRSERIVHADKMTNHLIQSVQQILWQYLNIHEKFMYMSGREYLYDSLNHISLEDFKNALQFIDSHELADKLNSINSKSINVKIGQEIDRRLPMLSLVSTHVTSDDYMGRIAVVGPKQMSYRRVFQELSAL